MKCTLCGHSFSPDQSHRACQACWLAKFCSLVRCPNCGFEMPPEGEAAAQATVAQCAQPPEFFTAPQPKAVHSAGNSSANFTLLKDTITVNADYKTSPSSSNSGVSSALTALEPGRTARIARIDTSRRDGLRQLLALGLLPNTEITLLRRFPTLVVQLGHSQFAIDRELASLVFVQ